METSLTWLGRLMDAPDSADWRRLLDVYGPLLHAWLGRAGVPEAERDDLVQEVFLVLVQKLPQFRYDPQRSFRAWLWTILANKLQDHRRRRAVLVAVGGNALDAATEPDPTEGIDEEEYRHFLMRRALEVMQTEFQPATWKAFWECVLNERPAAEVPSRYRRCDLFRDHIALAAIFRCLGSTPALVEARHFASARYFVGDNHLELMALLQRLK